MPGRQKGDLDKAIADYTETIRLEPDGPDGCPRVANLGETSEYAKAIADYTEAIRIDPEDPSAYNNRAWLWATCPDAPHRDGKQAVASATRACELTDWKDASDLDTLAAAYAETGDFDAAVKWQEKAIKAYTEEKDRAEFASGGPLRAKKPYRDEAKAE